jgi:hypothetical protein
MDARPAVAAVTPSAGADRLASPYALLTSAADDGVTAREFLALTYTADLGFFERFPLAPITATGAVITVCADAAMVTADPWTTRRAGRAYTPGLPRWHLSGTTVRRI